MRTVLPQNKLDGLLVNKDATLLVNLRKGLAMESEMCACMWLKKGDHANQLIEP